MALAVAVVSAAPVALQQVEKKEYPGVRNFSRVDATIACGGATTPEAMAALKQDGFVSVVNLRRAEEAGANVEAEKAAAEAAGVRYFRLPFNASAPATDSTEAEPPSPAASKAVGRTVMTFFASEVWIVSSALPA